MFEIKGKHTTAKVWIDSLEEECVSQITRIVNHPAFRAPVAIMPDAHAGKGCVVGFTMFPSDKIVPNVVGVDIGCGMLSINLKKHDLDIEDLRQLDKGIRATVPMGFEVHEKPHKNTMHGFLIPQMQKKAALAREAFPPSQEVPIPQYDERWFGAKVREIGAGKENRAARSLGTLGGGNHFIEIGRSQNTDELWLTIHTGSRNFGLKVCNHWQGKAVKALKRERMDKQRDILKQLPPEKRQAAFESNKVSVDLKGLEYLEDIDLIGYLDDMIFAQEYACVNRARLGAQILKLITGSAIDAKALARSTESVCSIHNCIDAGDNFITRKGAIRSYEGEKMIIPFNMRDGILICEGKSNPDWNFSAPHGAGRVMSRSQAKRELELWKFQDEMKDVYSTSVVQSTLDEAPAAYKDSKLIEEALEPTATILDRLKPVLNIKAV